MGWRSAQLQGGHGTVAAGARRDAGRTPAVRFTPVVRDRLRLRLGHLPHETFCVLLPDARHRLIEVVDLFRGTLTQTSVYPREVVKLALARNAAPVIPPTTTPPAAERAPPTNSPRAS